MNMPDKSFAIGISPGVALFVVVITFLSTMAVNTELVEKFSPPAAIDPTVVAPAVQLGNAFAAVAMRVRPAVVSVYSEKTVKLRSQEFPFLFDDDLLNQFFGRQPESRGKTREYSIPQSGMGSGMVLDRLGHILTNYHVVSGVDRIRVQLADRRNYEARVVGADPKTDVAVIVIAGKIPKDLAVVELGDSDALEVGHLVLAVGAPFGLTQTVTSGIISAKGRSDVGIAAYEDFLQTDTSINPGNSGGPLVNMRGEVIGMNSAIVSSGARFGGEGQSSGVGFAIPSNMIKAMLPTLIKGGQITRGMLGIVFQDVTKDLMEQFHLKDSKGALVSQVNRNSPAEKAGLKVGDVIVRMDGKEINDTRQLRNLIAAAPPASVVKIDVIREGKVSTLTAKIGAVAHETVEKNAPVRSSDRDNGPLNQLGMMVQELKPDLAAQLHLEGESGVVIVGVAPGSPAAIAGLMAGDLITEINHESVSSPREFLDALNKTPDQVLLLVRRNGASQYLLIQLK